MLASASPTLKRMLLEFPKKMKNDRVAQIDLPYSAQAVWRLFCSSSHLTTLLYSQVSLMLEYIYTRGVGDWEILFAPHLNELMSIARFLHMNALQETVHRLRVIGESFATFCRELSFLEE